MKKYLIFCFIFIIPWWLQAQPGSNPYWERNGSASLNLSQASFSSWSAGGESALGLDVMGIYNANFKKEPHILNNRLELAYGLNRTSSNGTRKTNDKIYLSSTYGYQLGKTFYLSGLLTFQTQFTNGFNYEVSGDTAISKFMAPGYLLIGTGITWTPTSYFTATLTPATWQGTFVSNKQLSDEGAFGVKKGKHLFSEFGANLKMEVTYEFLTNMNIYTRLVFYSNYLHQPQNMDVHWDILLNMKINKWFSTNFTANLIYDNDIKTTTKNGATGPRVQFKELLGVGLQVIL